MKKPKPKWDGLLNKPITRLNIIRPSGASRITKNNVASANVAMAKAIDAALEAELNTRLELLFQHYKIEDQNDWKQLALALATECVPGFQISLEFEEVNQDADDPKPFGIRFKKLSTGRPKEWPLERLLELHSEIQELRKAENDVLSEKECIRRLARRSKWSAPYSHRGESGSWVETLESRLQDAKRHLRQRTKLTNLFDKLGIKY